jgi:hypothetical protein
MGARQRRWAFDARLRLIEQLGGMCVHCHSTEKLEIDHKDGRDWIVSDYDPSARVCRYRKEVKEGLLQVLCKVCNKLKGGRRRV